MQLRAGKRIQGEVLPVPPSALDGHWKPIARFFRRCHNANVTYDVDRLHARLVAGIDMLWIAVVDRKERPIRGVIVTSITNRSPSGRRYFDAHARSLTVHLATGRSIEAWIDSAVERITRYGREQGCKQLFLICRKSWRQYAVRFYDASWEHVGIARDRKGKLAPHRLYNRVGHFREVVPSQPGLRYTSAWHCILGPEIPRYEPQYH